MESQSRRRSSIWALGYVIGPFVLALVSRRPLVDNSFLWHITAGDIQRDLHRALTTDPFSFQTLGEPWRTQSWLAELLYSWGVETFDLRFGQWIGLIAGGLFFLVLGVLVRSVARTGVGTAVVLAMSTIVMLPYLQPRPVIFSYLFLALLLTAIRHERLTWTIPLLVWTWASLHGSFFLAFVVLGTEWFRLRRRDLIGIAAVSLVVVNGTAHGWGVWEVLLSFSQQREALGRISEWLPPDFLSPRFLPVLLALVVFIAYVAQRSLSVRDGFPLLAWFLFGLTASRSMPIFWIVALPTVVLAVELATSRITSSATTKRSMIWVLATAMIGLPLLAPREQTLDPERFPIEAARSLTADRVFHDDVTGGYMIYEQWPERLVYIDDRAELYGDRIVTFADARLGLPGWDAVLDEAAVTQALVRRTDAIASLMTLSPAWNQTYADDIFLVFDRNGP